MTRKDFITKAALAASAGFLTRNTGPQTIAGWVEDYVQALADKLEEKGIEWDEEPMKINVDNSTPTKRAQERKTNI